MVRKWLVTGAAGLSLLAAVGCAGPERFEQDRKMATQAFMAGNYMAAEQGFERNVYRAERFGPNDPRLAASLNDLGLTYFHQAKYKEAESLFLRARDIQLTGVGPDHANLAETLNNLAFLYVEQGRYREAEPLYHRALSIQERNLGEEHVDVATTLNNLLLGPIRGEEERERILRPNGLSPYAIRA